MILPIVSLQNRIETPYGALLMTGFIDTVPAIYSNSTKVTSGIVAIYVSEAHYLCNPPKTYEAREIVNNIHIHIVCRRWGTSIPGGNYIGVANLICVEGCKLDNTNKIPKSKRDYISWLSSDRLFTFGDRIALKHLVPKLKEDKKGPLHEDNLFVETERYPDLYDAYKELKLKNEQSSNH